jgi:outer membrane protein assembly factor BamB
MPASRSGSAALIAVLLCLLAGISAGGILLGRALVKGEVATTAAPPPAPRPKPHRPAGPHLGPFAITTVAEVPGGPSAAAAATGTTLVVVGGPRSENIVSVKPGARLVPVADFLQPRAAPIVFAAGGAVYVLGGESGTQPTDTIAKVDPATRKVSYGGAFEEPLAESGVAATSGGAYVVGGWTGQKYATAILRVGPTGSAVLVTRLPTGLRDPAVALVGNKLYVAGGLTQNGLSRALYVVDTASGTIRRLGTLPEPLDQALLLASAGRLYLMGGRTAAGKELESVVAIDPATGAVRAAGRLRGPLVGASALAVGGRTLVLAPALGLVYRLA